MLKEEKKKLKVIISVGGTGGHVIPAMTLAQELAGEADSLFVGGKLGENRYFSKESFPFRTVSCSPSSVRGIYRNILGVWESLKILRKERPDLVVGFGSYHSFPTLVAAKLLRIPLFLHESNSIPGRVNRWLSPYAEMTALQFPGAAGRLRGKSVEVLPPLRKGYSRQEVDRKQALAYFSLKEGVPTILIFGGSQGAMAINKLFLEAAKGLDGVQVIHLTGSLKWTKRLQEEYKRCGIAAFVAPYEENMQFAWALADLFVGRAGAMTIAEQLSFQVPAIYLPYPFAMDKHQEKNSQYVVQELGGALSFPEKELPPEKLLETLSTLFADQHAVLNGMRRALQVAKEDRKLMTLKDLICKRLKNTTTS